MLLYVEAWLTVGMALLAAGLSLRNALKISNAMRTQRLLQAAFCFGLAAIYLLILLGWIETRLFFDLALPGYLALLGIMAAREIIGAPAL